MTQKILIVDDEPSIREALSGILIDEGFVPVNAETAEQAINILSVEEIDLVLLDIWMPGMDGVEALKQIKKIHPELPVIMISGHGTIETAVQATKIGAYDFFEKPLSYDRIILAINNGLHLSRLKEENRILRQQTSRKPRLEGSSPAMTRLLE